MHLRISALFKPRRRRARSRGFTLMEVLVALVLFAISVVGLTAMESRSFEAQRSARDIRDGQRIAQLEMSELMSRGFEEMCLFNFQGNAVVAKDYNDFTTATVHTGALPYYETPGGESVDPARVLKRYNHGNEYKVLRSVTHIDDPADPWVPALGICDKVHALQYDVTVIWIDYSNPVFPPPASASLATVNNTNYIDPSQNEFEPYYSHVRMTSVRGNDIAE